MDTKALRQRILDLAIRGKLVPQDPNDEPASVLLERIRAEKERLIAEGKIKRPKKSKSTSAESHYRNMPFEAPSSWVWCKLEDITTAIGDGLHGTPEYDSNGDYFFVNGNNLSQRRILIRENTKRVSKSEYEKYKKPLCETTILISINGTIGNVGIYNSERIMLGKSACYMNFSTHIDINYMCNLLESNYFLKYAIKSATGSTIKNVPLRAINEFVIAVPPFAEQKRIVEEIECWLSLIGMIESGKEELQTSIEQAKSRILDLAIHGKLVPQNPEDEPAAELLHRVNPNARIITDNPHYGNIPKTWGIVNLGDIFNHNTGKALNSSNLDGEELDYLTTSNVYWDTFDLSVVKRMKYRASELDKCTVKKGDLLVCEGGDIGRSAIWPYDYNICIQNHIHRLRPKGELSVRFYYFVLLFLKTNNLIRGKGIGLLGLSANALHNINVPFAPLFEQKQIVAKIEELFAILDEIQKSLEA